MSTTSPITTHVLDTTLGRPARELQVVLEHYTGADLWKRISEGATDDDGRIDDLLEPGQIEAGLYRITFDTDGYFGDLGIAGFYPSVSVNFEVTDEDDHYHVPLLLSPFGYSTYRGS